VRARILVIRVQTGFNAGVMSSVSAADWPELPTVALPPEPWLDWLRTQVGTVLDQTVVEAMRRVIDAALMPSPTQLPALRAAAVPFLSGPLWEEPRRYFAFLDAPADVVAPETRYRRPRAGGVVIGRRFAGRYRPFGGTAERGADAGGILVEHWMHQRDRPRATLLALHGFSMGQPRVDGWALFADGWFRSGLDVALLTLPYHGARTPPGARFSGQRFAEPNPAAMNDAVRQAIYEVHVLRRWLREHTGVPVGLLGLSLGGYLSALMAGLSADLAFVIPMVPPVCLGDLAWRFVARSGSRAAYSHAELRAMYRVHSPLTYPLQVPKERVLIIAGRGDRIVPPEHPHALWLHWGQPAIHWFSGSHLAPFGRDRILAAGLAHLRGLGIL
jgi:Alpha/beta hydrolase domain containing 18